MIIQIFAAETLGKGAHHLILIASFGYCKDIAEVTATK